MLTIIRSNAVEALLSQLADRLSAAPLSSPLLREVVVVPSPAMARWVNLQLAQRLGISAAVDYPLPASFVWAIGRSLLEDLPEDDPLAADPMAWRIFGLVPGMLATEALEPLRLYLHGDEDGRKRLQLASRIAEVFERYQLYRPQLVRRWQAGEGTDWQALLWRALAAGLEDKHRVAVIDRLLGVIDQPRAFPNLPERISLFAVSSLPPLFVQVIQALASRVAVDLYLHAPTEAFWSDLISQKDLARKRLAKPEEAELWEVGNSLLASWGRQGQALQDLLLERELPLEEVDAFREPTAETLLGRLQRDIFELRPIATPESREEACADSSLQVHVCHSPLRECQVLHDQLLGMLESEPDLRPEDILVMVPEIGRYAPYIEAVFDRDRARDGDRDAQGPFIPWNLSDIGVADEHPLVLVFLALLNLPDSRFTYSQVLAFLDAPELAEHFGLGGDALVRIKGWLGDANLRWGCDSEHKRRLGLPEIEDNTWAQAEKRLFAGYALGESEPFADIVPIGGIEGPQAELLGRFWRLLSKLTEAARRLVEPRTARDWQDYIGSLLLDFFGDRDDADGRLQTIRDAVADLTKQASAVAEPLSIGLVRAWLQRRLGTESRHGRFFSGGVTFCGMRPMRSLPFQVICVLGMHDRAFPRRDRPADFDLTRRDWRPGDPRPGDEDRFLLLETLLCARRRLYLGYVGRDVRANNEREPSVLVRELLDYLDQQYRVAGGKEGDKLSKRLTVEHPLQPFSPRNFSGYEPSYDAEWCEVAQAMLEPPDAPEDPPPCWASWRLPEAPEPMRELTLAQLERFLCHPVRNFVNTRLRLYLRDEEAAPDAEPFALDSLQGYALRQRLVQDRLAGRTPSPRQLCAEGALPHGAFAALAFEQQQDEATPLLRRLDPYSELMSERVAVDLKFDETAGPRRLTGRVAIYPGLGLMHCKPGKRGGADLLRLWLAHLAWCTAGEPGEKHSRLYTSEGGFTIAGELDKEAARGLLARYLALYWEGTHRPLPLLPKASFAYARVAFRGKGDPMNAATSAWNGNGHQGFRGDKDDPYVRLVLRGVAGDPLANPAFSPLARELFDPLLAAGEEDNG